VIRVRVYSQLSQVKSILERVSNRVVVLVRLASVLMPRDAFSRPAGGARVSESCEYVRAQKARTVPGIYFFKIANTYEENS
jgi:hypothetical protein